MFTLNTSPEQRKGQESAFRHLALAVILPFVLTILSAACGASNDGAMPPLVNKSNALAEAKSVFVRDGDVYVGGIQYDPSLGSPNALPCAVIWRNGETDHRVPERAEGYIKLEEDGFINPVRTPFLATNGSVYALIDTNLDKMGLPAYWKDGKVHFLDNPVGSTDEDRFSLDYIFVTDSNNVYITGTAGKEVYYPETHIWTRALLYGVLWKNGEPAVLSDGGRLVIPGPVFVYGEDVYVAGFVIGEAGDGSEVWDVALWKNGERLHLDGSGISPGLMSLCVFVHGDDVYVSCYNNGWNYSKNYMYYSNQNHVVGHNNGTVVWKNGAKHLELKPEDRDSRDYEQVDSLFVSGGDVYLAGTMVNYTVKEVDGTKYYMDGKSSPVVWKNGNKTVLPTPAHEYSGDSANAVFVQGDDVYVAGNSYDHAVLWKNGVRQELPFAVPAEYPAN